MLCYQTNESNKMLENLNSPLERITHESHLTQDPRHLHPDEIMEGCGGRRRGRCLAAFLLLLLLFICSL